MARQRRRAGSPGSKPESSRGTVNLHVAARERAVARILKAGESVFGRLGFDGATTAEIAREAGISKATVHYYFKIKEDLYAAVLDRIHVVWETALSEIREDREPDEALRAYIERKMSHAREYPELTRLWALEVISGGARVESFLRGRTRKILAEKEAILRRWIAQGKMDKVDTTHLFFLIWAMTQTYAEAEAQMLMVLDGPGLDDPVMRTATATVTHILIKGLGIRV